MHVDHQRFAGELLGGDAGIVAKPVVGVDDVEFILSLHGDGAAHHGIAGHLLHEVGAVLAGKLVLLAIADGEVFHLAAFFFFDELAKLLRIGVGNHVGADVDELDLVQVFFHRLRHGVYGNIRSVDDRSGALVFVTRGRRHHEKGFHAVVGEALYDTFAGRTQTARDVGRKLPAEHKYSHSLVLPVFGDEPVDVE